MARTASHFRWETSIRPPMRSSGCGRGPQRSKDEKYLYVDEHLQFVTGDEAARSLTEHSDAAFLDPMNGVVRVPKQRWQEAQKYERNTWLVANLAASDDRNTQHEAAFGNYSALAGRTFHNAVEL